MAFCGVCGSDIPRTFVKGTYHFPTVIGHEFSGTVEACGPGVEDFADGDRVVVRASPHHALFARVQERTYFYKTLMARLLPGREDRDH